MKLDKLLEFEHIYNPMHFYSRLRDLGIEKREAIRWARIYESGIYNEVHELINEQKKIRKAREKSYQD